MSAALVEPFAQFIEVLTEPALVGSAEGTILAANARAAELLGQRAESIAGRPLSDLVVDGSVAVREFLDRCSETGRSRRDHLRLQPMAGVPVNWRIELAFVQPRQDGEPAILMFRFAEGPANRITATGSSPYSPSVAAGAPAITEKANIDGHEWFRTTLSSIGDAVLTTDRTGCVTFMNPVAERLTGWMLAEAKGQPLGTVFHTGNHGSRGIERCVTRALLDDVVSGRAHHTTLVNRTGMEYAIEVTAAPIREDAGRTWGVVMVLRDVAERLALEEELSRTAEELVSAQRSKDEFLAMLAHELRNPLAPLRNGIQILRSLHGEDPHLDHVEAMMERQIRHLARLVDDLLDVSRITRGLTSLRLETVPLRLVLEHALEITRPVIMAGDHELNIALPPDSLCVEVDVLRASQVIANLLINAAEYTPPGGRIALTGSAEGDNAVVRVIDSGIGIPSDFLPNVFELFTQADRSLNRAPGGLGIGLTVVKALVAMHGGRVHALSDGVGLGSEFVVKLPAVTRHDPGHVEPEAPAGDTKPPRAKRILVVDDNVDAAESLAMILGLWGHDVRSASSGEEALELALAFAPDVVLLDLGLPVMTGYEVARRLRNLTPTRNAMIVAVTGYGRDEDRRRSREAGIDRHLTKPVEPAALEALLAG